jgi:hypothetical protein
MSVTIDRVFSVLLAVLSAGHGFIGVLSTQPFLDSSTVWAFSGSVAAWAVAVLNWLRAGRPDDIVIAAWAVASALAWMLLMIWLAVAAEMLQDARIWLFVFVSGGLAIFGLRDIVRAKHSG